MSTATRDSADIGSPCVPDDHRHHLAGRGLHDVLRAQQNAVGNGEQAQIVRDLGGVVHAAAEERHLAAVLVREIQNLLQAVNGGAEAGDHQAARRAHEQILEARAHGAFAFGVAGPIDVGRIRHQQQHAALAVFGQRVQIEEHVVGGRRIDFEIAGVNDHAQRRRDGQQHAAHNRVRDVDELDRERPERRACRRA